MKATMLWGNSVGDVNNADNSSGFSALPGDRRQQTNFHHNDAVNATLALFWSSTVSPGGSQPNNIQVDIRMGSSFSINSQTSFHGGSVRCIKTQAGPGPN